MAKTRAIHVERAEGAWYAASSSGDKPSQEVLESLDEIVKAAIRWHEAKTERHREPKGERPGGGRGKVE